MTASFDPELEKLYKESFPQVARTIARMGGDQDAAKDLFHDALIVYLEKIKQPGFSIQTTPAAYLSGIARILWVRQFNQSIRFDVLKDGTDELDLPDDLESTPPDISLTLLQWLQQTGQKCMQLLTAFYYDQLSMDEIAGRFNYKTRHSATVQKHKCLEKMRDQIKQNAASYETIAA